MTPERVPPIERGGDVLTGRCRLPRALARAAAVCLLLAGPACTALIDQELSGKTSGAGTAGDGGSAGGGGTGGQVPTGTITTCRKGCVLPHATATCSMGACEVVDCVPHFADCNGASLDGCEVDLRHDGQHCGECGEECQGDARCDKGECE